MTRTAAMSSDGARATLGALRRLPIPPMPPNKAGRLRWLNEVDAQIAADTLAMCERMASEGRARSDIESLVDAYPDYLSARLRAAVDMAISTWIATTPPQPTTRETP